MMEPAQHISARWTLYTDGAARNNPGAAGAGLLLERDGVAVLQQGYYIGTKTNNQAEYIALLLGLAQAAALMEPHDKLIIRADSQLLIRQLQAMYAVKDVVLKHLHAMARQLMQGLVIEMHHIDREANYRADALANEGIDKMIPVPDSLWLRAVPAGIERS